MNVKHAQSQNSKSNQNSQPKLVYKPTPIGNSGTSKSNKNINELTKVTDDKNNNNEIPMELNVKPTKPPTKEDKNDQIEGISEDSKQNRLKAFNLMKKKESKEEMNKNINSIEAKKKLNQNITYKDENFPEANSQLQNPNNMSIFNNFIAEKQKFFETKDNYQNPSYVNDEENQDQSNSFEVKLKYSLGVNTNSNAGICYHKQHRWVAYVNKNLVILEEFENEQKSQICLSNSEDYLESLKISENGKILMAFNKSSKTGPKVFFWEITSTFSPYKLINKTCIKHQRIIEVEFSPQNNMCVVLSNYYKF